MIRVSQLIAVLVLAGLLVSCGGRVAPDVHARRFTPAGLRSWYGLDRSDTGRGQVIVITEPFTAPNLVAAVDEFSHHFGLPGVCVGQDTTRCFQVKMLTPAGPPLRVEQVTSRKGALWLHGRVRGSVDPVHHTVRFDTFQDIIVDKGDWKFGAPLRGWWEG